MRVCIVAAPIGGTTWTMPTRAEHKKVVLAYYYRLSYLGETADIYVQPIIDEFCPPYSPAWIEDAAQKLAEDGKLGTSQSIQFHNGFQNLRNFWKAFVPTGVTTSRFISDDGEQEIEQDLADAGLDIFEYIERLKGDL
jgi:hypothetical protein